MKRGPLLKTNVGHPLIQRERLQHIAFQHLDLLLNLSQLALRVFQQVGAALVSGERVSQRQLAAFEIGDKLFELLERGFKGLRRGFGPGQS